MDVSAFDVDGIEPERIRPLKRVEFEQLAAKGAFDEERVELLFGVLVAMSPIDPAHDQSISELVDRLREGLRGRAVVRSQSAFAATDYSEPLPDVVVVPAGEYWTTQPDRAYLAIEVANSSLRRDRTAKARLYAGARVDEYWIVNLAGRTVEVYRDRAGPGWGPPTIVGRAGVLAMRAFPDVAIRVSEIVPPG